MSRGLGESAHAPEHSRPLRRQISPSASEFRFAEEMAMAGISLAPGLALLDRLDKLEATDDMMDGMKKFHSMYGQKSGSSLSSTKAAAGGRIATAKPPEPKYAAANRELAEKSPDLFFENWPAAERRSTPAARTRKVIIRGLTTGHVMYKDRSTEQLVSKLVFGGPLESITGITETSAVVLFLDADDCERFYNATANGITYRKSKDPKERVAFVELGKEVDVILGQLRERIAQGATRCVTAIGNDYEVNPWKLNYLSTAGVSEIKDKRTESKRRCVEFRLYSVQQAVLFKSRLAAEEDWEPFNIQYGPDPCDHKGPKGKRQA